MAKVYNREQIYLLKWKRKTNDLQGNSSAFRKLKDAENHKEKSEKYANCNDYFIEKLDLWPNHDNEVKTDDQNTFYNCFLGFYSLLADRKS